MLESFYLHNSDAVFLVKEGQVFVFAVKMEGGQDTGRRFFLTSVPPGRAFWGIGGGQPLEGIGLLVTGSADTEIAEINRETALSAGAGPTGPALAELKEKWIEGIISDNNWLLKTADIDLAAAENGDWIRDGSGSEGLGWFYGVLCHGLVNRLNDLFDEEIERFSKRQVNKRVSLEKSFMELASVAVEDEEILSAAANREDALFEACRLVGQMLKIAVVRPAAEVMASQQGNPINAIAAASHFRTRNALLTGEWWKEDNGPMVAYIQEDQRPVALLPRGVGAYDLVDPLNSVKIRVDKETANSLGPFADVFYRPLPNRRLKAKDIIAFAAKGRVLRDVITVALIGLIGGLIGMMLPVATGEMIDYIIPEAEKGPLLQMCLVLLASFAAVFLFNLTRTFAMLRLEGRLDSELQAAVWDRLLNLPVPFFRGYSAGELAMRANSINAIRQAISGIALTTIISGIFSFANFFLLFAYSSRLALVALGLVIVSVGATVGTAMFQIKSQRQLNKEQGRLSGFILQILNGVAKFKVAGAEERAFKLWSSLFSRVRKISFKTANIMNYLETFNALFPVASTMILFAGAVSGQNGQSAMTTGQFMGFYSAFTAFIVAMTATSGAFISVLQIAPLYELAQPILDEEPEIDETKRHPGHLNGEIEVNRVSFSYKAEGPQVLDDLSMHVKPGEFAAIVGSSGCGKSTLLRILLGFEKPGSGAVYYDGQDLSLLDVRAVRSQFGVVLQNSKMMSGDIFTNIIGSKLLGIDDAWEAARMAGMEEDIGQMPMGMHTVVSEGGSTLSGGQRQRLMIARAVVSKPRIIFFDEATSALDNRTQAIVSQSLENLKATRIVIAHRLSTIINADRIFVMDKGRIVQSGTYLELMNQEGLFKELAQRQIA